jgi:hypothetical protein
MLRICFGNLRPWDTADCEDTYGIYVTATMSGVKGSLTGKWLFKKWGCSCPAIFHGILFHEILFK